MFENDDWDIDEDYFEDFNCDASKSWHNDKIKVADATESSSQTSICQQKDYFEDFNCDDVSKSCCSEKIKETTATVSSSQTFIQKKLENNGSLHDKSETDLSELCFNKVDVKSVVLDVFKNSDKDLKDLKQKNFNNYSENTSRFQDTSQKLMVLDIFQTSDSDNLEKNNLLVTKPAVKSVLKVTDSDLDNENKLKRKKSVAFSDSITESLCTKKLCFSEKSDSNAEQLNISNKIKTFPTILSNHKQDILNNSNNSRQQEMLNLFKSLAQKQKSPSIKNTVVRKFPGPAGLLVDENEMPDVISISTVDKNENKCTKYSNICSQNTKNLFTSGAWQLMIDDLPAGVELQDIATVKHNAFEYSQKFKKVPYLAGFIQCIDYKPNDPHVVLKDFSGKIDARIHHSICKLYPSALGTNVVVLVKDVGLIVTSKKYVCIIISPKNLVGIYSDDARLV